MSTRKNRLPKTKSPEEWRAFFAAINPRYDSQARNHAALYLMYSTGLRVGECLSLSVSDLDFDRMRLHVSEGKTGERNVPLPDDAALRTTIERWLAVRTRWDPDSPLLFVTKPGGPLDQCDPGEHEGLCDKGWAESFDTTPATAFRCD